MLSGCLSLFSRPINHFSLLFYLLLSFPLICCFLVAVLCFGLANPTALFSTNLDINHCEIIINSELYNSGCNRSRGISIYLFYYEPNCPTSNTGKHTPAQQHRRKTVWQDLEPNVTLRGLIAMSYTLNQPCQGRFVHLETNLELF